MLETLNFVKGAIARKDFVPTLNHYSIMDNVIQGSNGVVTISSPISIDFKASPKATVFHKAIEACDGVTSLTLTKTKRISVRSENFTALVECIDKEIPHYFPSGEKVRLSDDFLDNVRLLAPFMAEDASRPWANGINFDGRNAYATNNVILVNVWMGEPFSKKITIPKMAVKELLRINELPTHYSIGEKEACFYYTGGRWLRTSLLEKSWPNVKELLNGATKVCKKSKFLDCDQIIGVLQRLKPFTDDCGTVYFKNGLISTHGSTKEGAYFETEYKEERGLYNLDQLITVCAKAKTLCLTTHPKPSPFYGDKLRGVVIGMRDGKV